MPILGQLLLLTPDHCSRVLHELEVAGQVRIDRSDVLYVQALSHYHPG
jgi:hypothetical protein